MQAPFASFSICRPAVSSCMWLCLRHAASGFGACLQGVIESRTLEDAAQQKYTLALIARRSRLHPGMRYIARGLNSLSSPGMPLSTPGVPLPPMNLVPHLPPNATALLHHGLQVHHSQLYWHNRATCTCVYCWAHSREVAPSF